MSSAAMDLDVELGRFARQAQSLTLAGGASIALAPEGAGSSDEMTCRASAGEVAPRVGARVRTDLGFTRECVREGKALRWDDSEGDRRVDLRRFRKLGIRSVIAVPLRSGEAVVGIIEIFSPRTQAFTESHMAKLHALAERVTNTLMGTESTAAAAVAAEPGLIWTDLFVDSHVPWKRLLQSALCHLIVVGIVWDISLNWARTEKILKPMVARHAQLTYYPSQSFPTAGGHQPRLEAPPRSESGPAPLVVKRGGEEPSASPPAVNITPSGGVELAGMRAALPAAPPVPGAVDAPQRASLAGALQVGAGQMAAVAPPPQIGGALRRSEGLAPGAFAVGPAPAIDGPLRALAGPSVGRAAAVGPAPGIPGREGINGVGMASMGLGGVRAIVGPPVSMPLHEGVGGSGLALGGRGSVVGPPAAMPTHEGSGGSRITMGGGGYTVVAPAPDVQGGLGGGSRGGGVTLGGGAMVVAPAPGLPGGTRSGVLYGGLIGGTGTVVGPPPGVPSGTRDISSPGLGGSGVAVVPPPPSVGGLGTGDLGSGRGGGLAGSGVGLGPGAGAGTGTGPGTGPGAGTGNGNGPGAGSGTGAGGSLVAGNGLGSGTGTGANTIRTSIPQQAPTHVDDPAGSILEVPVRVLGLALALPSSSFFSNYEVFIAEREFGKNEMQLIKLVYESRPTQRRLSEYGVQVATTYKLRVKRDPTCDESAAQITGGHYSELQNASPDAALRDEDKDHPLPCYRTTADDYQKAAAKKKR